MGYSLNITSQIYYDSKTSFFKWCTGTASKLQFTTQTHSYITHKIQLNDMQNYTDLSLYEMVIPSFKVFPSGFLNLIVRSVVQAMSFFSSPTATFVAELTKSSFNVSESKFHITPTVDQDI